MPAGPNSRTPVLVFSIDPGGVDLVCKPCAREYYPLATAIEITHPLHLVPYLGCTCDCCLKPVIH